VGGGGGGADNDDHIYTNVPEVFRVAKVSCPFSSHRGRTKLLTLPKTARACMANLYEVPCPNFIYISMKFFLVPVGILKSRIRSWGLP
jgi:hypothetical protein